MLSEVLGYLHKCQIPRVWDHRAYLLVWQEKALFLECRAVFKIPFPPCLYFPIRTPSFCRWGYCISMTQSHGGLWLGCQVLPALGAVSILEQTPNIGSFRMSQAHNFHITKKLLIPFEALTLSCNPQILLFLQFVVYVINLVYLAAGRSHVLTLESIDDVINQRQSGLNAYIK